MIKVIRNSHIQVDERISNLSHGIQLLPVELGLIDSLYIILFIHIMVM